MAYRKTAILLAAFWLLTCGRSDNGNLDKTPSQEEEFARKRFCAEIGRARLAEDNREKPDATLFTKVYAEWCYNKHLNTCIYSSTTTIAGKKDGESTPTFLESREIIDLLTNQSIVSLPLKNVNDRADSAEYEKRRTELLKECL